MGSAKGSKSATFVVMPAHGLKAFPRTDVPEEWMPTHTQTPPTQSDPGNFDNQIAFHSFTPRLDTSDVMTDPGSVGTIRFDMFPEVQCTRPKEVEHSHWPTSSTPPQHRTSRNDDNREMNQIRQYAHILKAGAHALAAKTSSRTEHNSALKRTLRSESWDDWLVPSVLNMTCC